MRDDNADSWRTARPAARTVAAAGGAILALLSAAATAAQARVAAPPRTVPAAPVCASSPELVEAISDTGQLANTFIRGLASTVPLGITNSSTTYTIEDMTAARVWKHTLAPDAQWTATYPAAGTYTFGVVGGQSGTLIAPFCDWQARTIDPGQATDLVWASKSVPGFAFDVEIKRPGATRWVWWRYANTTGWAAFSATAPGYYGFRSRIRRVSTNGVAGFSPTSVVHVR